MLPEPVLELLMESPVREGPDTDSDTDSNDDDPQKNETLHSGRALLFSSNSVKTDLFHPAGECKAATETSP